MVNEKEDHGSQIRGSGGKLRYIHRNPVEEGLVEEPRHYLYSSARDEAGLPGMLKLETIWGEAIADSNGNADKDG